MRFGIFFSYWEDDWKGDYFKYVKKARELGYDALEVSAGELLVMSKDKLRWTFRFLPTSAPPESTTFPPVIPRSARPVSRSTPI